MLKIGAVRTLQIAQAVNRLALSFLENRSQVLGPTSGPKALRKVFEEFGATYIKLGQFIASSPTLFPVEYVKEFQYCLDRTPSVPFTTIRKIIEEDLGKPLNLLFKYVNESPLASASIAQVHRAQLFDGTEVVIKVRKPGVDATLQADLSFLTIITKLLEVINPDISALSVGNIMSDIRHSMLDELDFRKELDNLNSFRAFLAQQGIEDAVAPQPFPAASSKRVLTMEYLAGVPLVDLEGLRRRVTGCTPEEALVSALRTWALSVALHDRFHADLHAGNLLVLQDGRVGFIDFGIGE